MPNMGGFLQPKTCYKVDQSGWFTPETKEATERFFRNETLMHVVVPLDDGLSDMMNTWVLAMKSLTPPTWFQNRVLFWAQQFWLIISMNQIEVFSLVFHADEHGHLLSADRLELKNATGHLELFPFHGVNFRTLRSKTSQLTKA
jgi:hypothetical protein